MLLGAGLKGLGSARDRASHWASFLVQVCKELHRFEKLMEYFRNEDSNIDFMVRNWAWVRRMPSRVPHSLTGRGQQHYLDILSRT